MRAVTLPPLRATIPQVAWPPMPMGRAATLANLVYELDRTQWLDPATIAAAQFAQLRVLAGVLARAVPDFRDRLAVAGLEPADIGTPAGFARLPLLTRQDLATAGPDAFARAVPPDHRPVTPAKTSGSTGAPVSVRRTAVTRLLWDALTIRDHLWRGIDFSQRILATRFGVTHPIAQNDWGPPVSSLFGTAPLEARPLVASVESLADRCIDFTPQVLLTYPSALDALVAHLAGAGRELRSVQFVHTYGEPLPSSVRDAATSAFDATIWDTYSCEEIGNIAATCPEGDAYHVHAESVVVEVLDDDGRPSPPGAVGRVVVTDLHNLATPLVRYEVGDYAVAGDRCPCGRGLPTLGRIVGREAHRARLPNGGWTWPQPVPLVRYRETAPIEQVQLVQRADGSVDVLAQVKAEPGAAAIEELTTLVHFSLGHPFPLRFRWRDRPVPRTRGGKYEWFRRESESP